MRHPLLIPAVALAFLASVAGAQSSTESAGGERPQSKTEQKPAPRVAIPADGEHATKALLDSPRHGEWIDISLDPKDPKAVKLKTWVSYPERKDKAPVVLVIHEIFGLTDWVRGVADQLAAEGFIAVAPDLLSGKGPEGGASDSFKGDTVRDAIRKLDANEVHARLDAARTHALSLPAASAHVSVMGFCWGGSTAFTYAAAQAGLDAAVVWYGTAPTDQATFAKVACPVLGLYGGDDARVTSTVEATQKVSAELKKQYSPKVYDGAGHGFLRQQTGRDDANLKAAIAAWTEALAFLRAQHTASMK